VETHGRSDTALLTQGLETLPLKQIEYNGRQVQEFDLDKALARLPALILVDELAHSNIPGSRHSKRWQDVEELLEAGVDVLTTVNVQHMESLNDIIHGITGIQVKETVPDHVFDEADEVVLVDLPPDDLRQRLREGKVYLAGQAEHAINNFFRKGNLIALRELALRFTADRVDEQQRAFQESSRKQQNFTRDTLLLCISHRPGNDKLVRVAARIAAHSDCKWHAIYVETPRLRNLPDNQRRAILDTLKLAQDLGAETATLSDPHPDQAVVSYAQENGLNRILVGRHYKQRRWLGLRDFADKLSLLDGKLDLIIISIDQNRSDLPPAILESRSRSVYQLWKNNLRGYLSAVLLTVLFTLLATSLDSVLNLTNIAMLYLLGQVIIALFFGLWPSILNAVLNIFSFDLLFIPPYKQVAVSDTQYLITFAVMLLISVIVGNLVASLRYQIQVARHREQRVKHMYEISKALSRALSPEDIVKTLQDFMVGHVANRFALLLPGETGHLFQVSADNVPQMELDLAIAEWCYGNRAPAGMGTDTLSATTYQLQPLTVGQQNFGILAFEPFSLRQVMNPEQQRLLQAYCVLITSALERLHLTMQTQETHLDSAREQLRSSLLASLSHDLRSPLSLLFSQAEILTLHLTAQHSPCAQQANALRQAILNTSGMITDLLEMAQLEASGSHLHSEWLAAPKLIEDVLRSLHSRLQGCTVNFEIADNLPLIHGDDALLQHALFHLVENAVKYAGKNSIITLTAQRDRLWLDIQVRDNGSGIDEEQLQTIFDKFQHDSQTQNINGDGLGLSICKTIIELHGGKIWASNHPQGGALFHIRLPIKKKYQEHMQ
ncbi:MAG: two-component system sensor histidine kinase KdpD, partial [Enterobacteriaceae bacterium]